VSEAETQKIAQQKAALRTEVLARRDAIAQEYREAKNVLIGAQLLQKVDWEGLAQAKEMRAWNALAAATEAGAAGTAAGKAADADAAADPVTVTVYAAMKSEPNVDGFAAVAYMHGARVCYPCMERLPEGNPEGRRMHMVFRAVGVDQRADCPFVRHPLQSLAEDDPVLAAYPAVDAQDLDVIIVPIVAFDNDNNRLGYGGGNYDRLLAGIRPDTQVIGVAFAEQCVNAVPCEPFDQPLQSIVSA
jgi:5-formyltetrahydrofolate cyclo-ligase